VRLLDPDAVLRRKILEFVERGDFGLASVITDGGGIKGHGMRSRRIPTM
jgi:hypothetical protein